MQGYDSTISGSASVVVGRSPQTSPYIERRARQKRRRAAFMLHGLPADAFSFIAHDCHNRDSRATRLFVLLVLLQQGSQLILYRLILAQRGKLFVQRALPGVHNIAGLRLSLHLEHLLFHTL